MSQPSIAATDHSSVSQVGKSDNNSRTPNRGSHMGPIRWACDSCHRSKWKCDEDGPSCGNCVRSSRDCTYSFRDKPAASATKTKTAPIAPRTPRVLLPKPTSPAVSESCNTIDPGGPPPIQDQPVYSAPSYMYHDTWYSTFNTESPQSLGNLGSSPTLQYPFQYPLQYPLLSPEDQTMTSTMQPMYASTDVQAQDNNVGAGGPQYEDEEGVRHPFQRRWF